MANFPIRRKKPQPPENFDPSNLAFIRRETPQLPMNNTWAVLSEPNTKDKGANRGSRPPKTATKATTKNKIKSSWNRDRWRGYFDQAGFWTDLEFWLLDQFWLLDWFWKASTNLENQSEFGKEWLQMNGITRLLDKVSNLMRKIPL